MSIDNIAEKYNKFQNDFGSKIEQDYDALIESLFSAESTKKANGKLLTAKRDELKNQLTAVRDIAGSWTMELKYLLKSATDQNYVIRYILNTKNLGSFDVTALLSSLDGIKIDFIDEIYYQVE